MSYLVLRIGRVLKALVNYSDWPGTINKINLRPDGIKHLFFQDPDRYWIEVNSVGEK